MRCTSTARKVILEFGSTAWHYEKLHIVRKTSYAHVQQFDNKTQQPSAGSHCGVDKSIDPIAYTKTQYVSLTKISSCQRKASLTYARVHVCVHMERTTCNKVTRLNVKSVLLNTKRTTYSVLWWPLCCEDLCKDATGEREGVSPSYEIQHVLSIFTAFDRWIVHSTS